MLWVCSIAPQSVNRTVYVRIRKESKVQSIILKNIKSENKKLIERKMK
jgi:hypothetical protein